MIVEVTHTINVCGFTAEWTVKHSDFKDNEEPRYTGYKRNYRKAKWSKHDFWKQRYELRPRCWKDQRGKGRNKRNTQYRVVAIA